MKQNKFSCSICKQTYTTKSGLSQHHKINHDELNAIKCNICLKSFANKSKLIIHKRVHTGKKPLSSNY